MGSSSESHGTWDQNFTLNNQAPQDDPGVGRMGDLNELVERLTKLAADFARTPDGRQPVQGQRIVSASLEAAAALTSLIAERDGLERQRSAALGMLRHLDDEIARVPAKPDPVTLNNLTYYAACLRTALSRDTNKGDGA